MPSVPDHPGYLGCTSQGVIAIHADWPAYPAEHGWDVALETLGQFPRGSVLRQIDDIDQCFLLVLEGASAMKDPVDSRHLHAAIWREDLLRLHTDGFVSGASEITRAQWIEKRRAELADLCWIDAEGIRHPVPPPTIEDFADEEESLVLMVGNVGISVTDAGWSALDEHLSAQRGSLHASVKVRAVPIVGLGQFDTAVREACLLLETRLRHIVGSKNFGQALVVELDAYLRSTKRFIPAQLKTFSLDIRTAFKFVRNEYVHGLHELTAVQCYALLARVSRILVVLDEVEKILAMPIQAPAV
jgi:hypothetical protein